MGKITNSNLDSEERQKYWGRCFNTAQSLLDDANREVFGNKAVLVVDLTSNQQESNPHLSPPNLCLLFSDGRYPCSVALAPSPDGHTLRLRAAIREQQVAWRDVPLIKAKSALRSLLLWMVDEGAIDEL